MTRPLTPPVPESRRAGPQFDPGADFGLRLARGHATWPVRPSPHAMKATVRIDLHLVSGEIVGATSERLSEILAGPGWSSLRDSHELILSGDGISLAVHDEPGDHGPAVLVRGYCEGEVADAREALREIGTRLEAAGVVYRLELASPRGGDAHVQEHPRFASLAGAAEPARG